MNERRQQKRTTAWRQTVRVAALALLLFAAADLAFPQNCQEETGPLWTAASVATSSSETGQSREAPPDASPLGDCFCCCSHVMSVPFVLAADATHLVSAGPAVLPTVVPPAPVRVPFHPPRLA